MHKTKGGRKKTQAKAVAKIHPPNSFWRKKSIEEQMKEQGIEPGMQLEKILGAGKDLWDSDEEFEEFVNGIYARRREDLEM